MVQLNLWFYLSSVVMVGLQNQQTVRSDILTQTQSLLFEKKKINTLFLQTPNTLSNREDVDTDGFGHKHLSLVCARTSHCQYALQGICNREPVWCFVHELECDCTWPEVHQNLYGFTSINLQFMHIMSFHQVRETSKLLSSVNGILFFIAES